MDGGGYIGQNEVPSPEGGRGSYRNLDFILYKHALFQIFVNLLKYNKMVGTNPF